MKDSIISTLRNKARQIKSRTLYRWHEQQHPGDYISIRAFDYYKCIFIHVPKAAGISVSKTLFGNLGGAHNKLTHYQHLYTKSTFEEYYKFTFVRNPWERLFSAYHFLKKGGISPRDVVWVEENLSHIHDFQSFVMSWLEEDRLNDWFHFIPQVDFLTDTSGKVAMDFIGKYEELEAGFDNVCARLKVNKKLPHLNKTTALKRNYKDFYTGEMIDKVARIYKKDVETLGYTF